MEIKKISGLQWYLIDESPLHTGQIFLRCVGKEIHASTQNAQDELDKIIKEQQPKGVKVKYTLKNVVEVIIT